MLALDHPALESLGFPLQAFICDSCGFVMSLRAAESQSPRWRPSAFDPYYEPTCDGCGLEGSLIPFNYYRATRKS